MCPYSPFPAGNRTGTNHHSIGICFTVADCVVILREKVCTACCDLIECKNIVHCHYLFLYYRITETGSEEASCCP